MLNNLINEPPIEIQESDFINWNVNRELLDNYNVAEDEEKDILRRVIQNVVFLRMRQKEITITDEIIQKQCFVNCNSEIKLKDQYGKFVVNCPQKNSNFCLLTELSIKQRETQNKLKEVFRSYQDPKENRTTIPMYYDRATIDKVKTCKSRIVNYIDSLNLNIKLGHGLTLSGNIGSGKTSILYLIIKELIKTDFSTYYVTAGDVMKYIIKDNTEFLSYLYYSDVLMIDDLGREYQKDENSFGTRQFDELIDFRYREGKTTFLTMNIYPKKAPSMTDKKAVEKTFEDLYPRIYDRLNERNETLIIVTESQRVSNWRDL